MLNLDQLEKKRIKDQHGSYLVYKVKCSRCGEEIWRRGSQLKIYKDSYCSRKCLYAARSNRVTKPCAYCGKLVTRTVAQYKRSISGNIFCSHSCNTSYLNSFRIGQLHPNYTDGISTYRDRGFKEHGAYCHNEDCKLRRADIEIPEIMLDVHHIDGNRDNASIENLLVLCVWCHVEFHRLG